MYLRKRVNKLQLTRKTLSNLIRFARRVGEKENFRHKSFLILNFIATRLHANFQPTSRVTAHIIVSVYMFLLCECF